VLREWVAFWAGMTAGFILVAVDAALGGDEGLALALARASLGTAIAAGFGMLAAWERRERETVDIDSTTR
jgi:hypothetical protein